MVSGMLREKYMNATQTHVYRDRSGCNGCNFEVRRGILFREGAARRWLPRVLRLFGNVQDDGREQSRD